MATDHRRRHDDEQRSALRRALIFPPPARNPFVHVLALGALGQGVGIVLGNPSPGSIETVLPHPLLYVWGLGLIGFWCGMIAAALWRDVLTGVLIERAACVIAILATGAYALGAIQVLGVDALSNLPVLVTILYGPASGVRAVQITQDLRRAHRLLQERGSVVRLGPCTPPPAPTPTTPAKRPGRRGPRPRSSAASTSSSGRHWTPGTGTGAAWTPRSSTTVGCPCRVPLT
jgi:hypothetical protein